MSIAFFFWSVNKTLQARNVQRLLLEVEQNELLAIPSTGKLPCCHSAGGHKSAPNPEVMRMICHRHYGVSSDDILLCPPGNKSCDCVLRIFVPDESEAELEQPAQRQQ
jgi:hypothetical protein